MPERNSNNTLDVLLSEIRAARTETNKELTESRAAFYTAAADTARQINEWQQEYGERLAKLESEVKSGISGNGQPSRLRLVEIAIEGLVNFRAKVAGGAAAGTILGAFLGSVITIVFETYRTIHGK